MPELRTRQMHVLVQDQGVRRRSGRIVTVPVTVPWEDLEPGPAGHRVYVVDYDSTTRTLYAPAQVVRGDFPAPRTNDEILDDPSFHALNAYALVMRTIGRFEYALGRRVSWGFDAHQLKVIPHAFEEANAFYSREAKALMFGYYRGAHGLRFMCLSNDIVVHETTHALLDGLRMKFTSPSTPDQAAFHEAFADIVALLSVFTHGEILGLLIAPNAQDGLVKRADVDAESLMDSVLLGVADQLGEESGLERFNALRRSVRIDPDPTLLGKDNFEFQEPHRRGEVLVAAVMRAFVEAWTARLDASGVVAGDQLDLGRVAEEGAAIADVLLTMAIRALDYTPPIHLTFSDYLSALLTADSEIRPSDAPYRLRERLRSAFAAYGIAPAASTPEGLWKRPKDQLSNEGIRLASLQIDRDEMFELVWANRHQLCLDDDAFMRVTSLRPCVRISPEDGFPLRETVAECTQYLRIEARDLRKHGLRKPDYMPDDTQIPLEGGSTLILDEYGRLKYEIHNRLPELDDPERLERWQERLDYLWDHGHLDPERSFGARLAALHRLRTVARPVPPAEVW